MGAQPRQPARPGRDPRRHLGAVRGAAGRDPGPASGRPEELRAAAERHRAASLLGHARELAAPAAAGVDTLTRREREIARMAAQGLTDKEIAASLVVPVRTVESHLAAAYRKLAIRSRRELSDLLRG